MHAVSDSVVFSMPLKTHFFVLLLTFVDYSWLLLMTLVMQLCSPCNRRNIISFTMMMRTSSSSCMHSSRCDYIRWHYTLYFRDICPGNVPLGNVRVIANSAHHRWATHIGITKSLVNPMGFPWQWEYIGPNIKSLTWTREKEPRIIFLKWKGMRMLLYLKLPCQLFCCHI